MMDKNELLAIYDREQRLNLRLPGMTYENTGRILRDTSQEEAAGFIDYSNLDESCADDEIDAQVAYFQSLGLPLFWKVFDHDRPPDLRQRLASRGFTLEPPNALLVLELDRAPDDFWSSALPDCLRPANDLAGIEEITRLEEEVWQGPRQRLKKRLARLLETHPDRLSLYAVWQDGRVVSAAWTFYYPPSPFAHLLGGATLPAYRQRGFYTALLAARGREARRRGCRFLLVDASPMSRPVLEKRGFQCLGLTTLCRWAPQA